MVETLAQTGKPLAVAEFDPSERFSGKTVLVTGGSRGIGAEICREFVRQGAARIIFVSRVEGWKVAESTRDELRQMGAEVIWIPANLAVGGTAGGIKQRLNGLGIDKIDVLVNNAGISNEVLGKPFNPEDEKLLWDTNVYSAFNLTYALAQNHLQEDSVVINVASTFALRPDPKKRVNTAYSETKAKLIEMTTLRAKLSVKNGVRMMAVAPGFVEGDNMASQTPKSIVKLFADATPGGELVTQKQVAEVICTIASDAKIDIYGEMITGKYITVDNGLGAKFTEVIMSDEVASEIQKKLDQVARIEALAASREARRFQAQTQTINPK